MYIKSGGSGELGPEDCRCANMREQHEHQGHAAAQDTSLPIRDHIESGCSCLAQSECPNFYYSKIP
jgi:hypothetical protein